VHYTNTVFEAKG